MLVLYSLAPIQGQINNRWLGHWQTKNYQCATAVNVSHALSSSTDQHSLLHTVVSTSPLPALLGHKRYVLPYHHLPFSSSGKLDVPKSQPLGGNNLIAASVSPTKRKSSCKYRHNSHKGSSYFSLQARALGAISSGKT